MENIRLGEFEQKLRKMRELFLLRKRCEVIEEGARELAEQLEFFGEMFWFFIVYGYSSDFEMEYFDRLTPEGAESYIRRQGRKREREEKIAEFIRSGSALLNFGLLELSIQRRGDLFPKQDNVVYLFDFSFMITFRNTSKDKDIIEELYKLGKRFGFHLEFLEGFSFLLVKGKEEYCGQRINSVFE